MRQLLFALYRVRGPLYAAAAAILIGNALVGNLTTESFRPVRLGLVGTALALAAVAIALSFALPRCLPTPQLRVVSAPVRGRWQGLNSPASAVPSHGVRAYGQTYAIDLAFDPSDTPRPQFGGAMMRAADAYPAFGQPVYAMITGTVVRVSDWRRDHRARSNGWGALYLMLEAVAREIGGPGFIVGNHVVIRGDDGTFAAVAHLQQRSSTVRVGARVSAGAIIAACGNSGNSSEPHVHAQLMDRRSWWLGQGIPLAFADITIGNAAATTNGLPGNGQHFTATETRPRPSQR